jgi:uncharacterized HAD superfamily protein
MKIGIDLDDVVFDFTNSFLKFYNEKSGKSIKFEEVKSYYFADIFNVPLNEVIGLIEEMADNGLVENLPLFRNTSNVISNLSKENEIFFITSRIVKKGTIESLNKNFPEIKFNLIYTANCYSGLKGKTKTEICLERGVNLMIEDSLEYAKDLANNGIKTILLDRPWNVELNHENVIRVRDWDEVHNEIKLIQKQ